jgi:hypothetical protein
MNGPAVVPGTVIDRCRSGQDLCSHEATHPTTEFDTLIACRARIMYGVGCLPRSTRGMVDPCRGGGKPVELTHHLGRRRPRVPLDGVTVLPRARTSRQDDGRGGSIWGSRRPPRRSSTSARIRTPALRPSSCVVSARSHHCARWSRLQPAWPLGRARGHRGARSSGPARCATDEAERRGLVLVLPASLEVTMVGDTGFEPVTSRM